MSVRKFNGSSDYISASLGSSGITSGSVVALVKLEGNGTERSIINLRNSGGSGQLLQWVVGGNKLSLWTGAANQESSLEVVEADAWLMLAITKASGSQKPKYYRHKFSTSAFTAAEGSALANFGSVTGGSVHFGNFQGEKFFKGIIAAVGIWSSVLTEAQVKALKEVTYLSQWKSFEVAPSGLWFFNQGSVSEEVTDQTGNGANQSGRSGTSVVAEEPPIPFEAASSGPGAGSLSLLGVGR